MATLEKWLELSKTSQRALAQRVGISKTFMNEIVRGEKSPGLRVALEIQRETNGEVPLASLLKASADPPEAGQKAS